MKISTKITDEKAVEHRLHNSIYIKIRKMLQFSQANWIDSDIWLMIRHTHFFCLTWAAQLKFSIGSYYLHGRYVFLYPNETNALLSCTMFASSSSLCLRRMEYHCFENGSCFVHLKNGRPAYFQGSFKIRTRKIR